MRARSGGAALLGATLISISLLVAPAIVRADSKVNPSTIFFASERDPTVTTEIWRMNADGSNPVRLTFDDNFDTDPAPSPDGQRVAFYKELGTDQIFVMNADGSNPVNVSSVAFDDRNPKWSPDGEQIVFTSDRTGASQIWVMNADGSNPRQLTFGAPAGQNKGSPDWSPDGQHIVYFSQPSGTNSDREIFEMNADGSNQLQLTFNGLLDARPSYSPDGKRILFYRQTAAAQARPTRSSS